MAFVEIPFTVEPNYAGWRLDRYLGEKLKRASRTQVQRIIKEQLVQDGPHKLKPSTPVVAGMRLRIRRPEVTEPEGLPDRLEVLHDDPDVLVVDKPAGLPVHPTARYFKGTATTILGRDHRSEDGVRPDPAHRLDRETSGVLVCGRHREATRALKLAFAPPKGGAGRLVEKTYLAIVHGDPAFETTRLDRPLALVGEHAVRIRMSIVAPDHKSAQPAATRVRVVERRRDAAGRPFALLECALETGRQHQIRAHLQAAGHPVVGDKIYGPDEAIFIRFTEGALTPVDREALLLERQALHAASIVFPHPATGERIRVESPLPDDLRWFWDGLQVQGALGP